MPFRSVLGEKIAGDVHGQEVSIMVHSHTVGSGQRYGPWLPFSISILLTICLSCQICLTEMDADWHIHEEW